MIAPELSIIIPAYNVQRYINRCVDSIMRQQGADQYEIIIVDDGSTDKTPKIVDFAATKHKNIRVFHQKNAGVSVARNLGIRESHGKYITFVDADDMVGLKLSAFDEYFAGFQALPIGKLNCSLTMAAAPIKLSKAHFDDAFFVNMLHVAHDTKAEVVLGGKIAINDKHILRQYFYDSVIIRGIDTDAKSELLAEAAQREFANSALYSRDMLDAHDLHFMANMDLDEDILFCMLALLYAKKVATAPDVTYFYDNHVGTLSNMTDDRIYAIKYKTAQVKKFAVLLNEIAKMPQYMTKNMFGYWVPFYIDAANIETRKCFSSVCPQTPENACANCSVAKYVLTHSKRTIEKCL